MSTPQSWYEYAAKSLRPEPRLLGYWTADKVASPEQVKAAQKVCMEMESPFTIDGITWTWRPA